MNSSISTLAATKHNNSSPLSPGTSSNQKPVDDISTVFGGLQCLNQIPGLNFMAGLIFRGLWVPSSPSEESSEDPALSLS